MKRAPRQTKRQRKAQRGPGHPQPLPDESKVEHRDPDVDPDGPHVFAWLQGTKLRMSIRNVNVDDTGNDDALTRGLLSRMRDLGVQSGVFRLPL